MLRKRANDVDALVQMNNSADNPGATRYSPTGTALTVVPAQVEAVRRAQ